jgi:drug/metabolite transporter (DMT)-like permease
MEYYSPFAATQIRIIMGIAGLILIITVLRKWDSVIHALKVRKAMRGITIGSFFGPFLGVSFSLMAIRYTSTGVASTIMATVPIFIILPNIWFFNHKLSLREIAGTILSIAGVALFFL